MEGVVTKSNHRGSLYPKGGGIMVLEPQGGARRGFPGKERILVRHNVGNTDEGKIKGQTGRVLKANLRNSRVMISTPLSL